MTQAISSRAPRELPIVRTITFDRPAEWLSKGARDIMRAPAASLGYGAIWVVTGYLMIGLLVQYDLAHYAATLITGFFLVGPLVAVGFYEISRRLELGQEVRFADTWHAWSRHPGQVATLGVMLMVILLAWIRLATLIFALMFQGVTPDWAHFVTSVLLSAENLPLLLVGTVTGGILAGLVFGLTVISAPMLMDRNIDAFSAVILSMRALKQNPGAMLLWSFQIVLFVGAGLATLMLGLIFTLPLIGHATWHAYQDLAGD